MERDKGEKDHERQHGKALKAYIKKSLSVPETNEESLMNGKEEKGMIIFAFQIKSFGLPLYQVSLNGMCYFPKIN